MSNDNATSVWYNCIYFVFDCYRLAATAAGNASLQELTLLAAARRSVVSGGGGVTPHGAGLGVPSSNPNELHPAYRLNPYVEHLYSSLHSSPTTSLRGMSPLDPRGNHQLHSINCCSLSIFFLKEFLKERFDLFWKIESFFLLICYILINRNS